MFIEQRKRQPKTKGVAAALALGAIGLLGNGRVLAQSAKIDTDKIDSVIGAKGTWFEGEGIYKVTFPRTDVVITVDGRKMEPFMGFTSWAAFQTGKAAQAMVMGDFVLMQDEVNPVMDACFTGGLTVTALHNHFFFDEPRVYFMHIGGEGTAEQLAAGVRKALDTVKQVRSNNPEPARSFGLQSIPTANAITAAPLEETIGAKGQAKDGMIKFVIGRTVQMSCGCSVGKEMGVNTWAAFAGTDEHALVDGDFACLPGELQSTLKSLRQHGINIVAIHHHMEGESPRVIFLHYWGVGPTAELAKGVRAGLDAQGAVYKKQTGDDK